MTKFNAYFLYFFGLVLIQCFGNSTQAQTTDVLHEYLQLDFFPALGSQEVNYQIRTKRFVNEITINSKNPTILTVGADSLLVSLPDILPAGNGLDFKDYHIHFVSLELARFAKFYLDSSSESLQILNIPDKTEYHVKGSLVSVEARDIVIKNPKTETSVGLLEFAVTGTTAPYSFPSSSSKGLFSKGRSGAVKALKKLKNSLTKQDSLSKKDFLTERASFIGEDKGTSQDLVNSEVNKRSLQDHPSIYSTDSSNSEDSYLEEVSVIKAYADIVYSNDRSIADFYAGNDGASFDDGSFIGFYAGNDDHYSDDSSLNPYTDHVSIFFHSRACLGSSQEVERPVFAPRKESLPDFCGAN